MIKLRSIKTCSLPDGFYHDIPFFFLSPVRVTWNTSGSFVFYIRTKNKLFPPSFVRVFVLLQDY